MTITINLADSSFAGLQQKARRQHVSIEELAVKILADSIIESAPESIDEVVARIKAIPPAPGKVRPASPDLAGLLGSAPEDPDFNLEEWRQSWALVEGEMRSLTRANDFAEGRGQAN